MKYMEAKKLLKGHCRGCIHPQQMEWCKSHCEIRIAIEALDKQNKIVYCKDCRHWIHPLQIEGFDGNLGTTGECSLTDWLCGEQGYCMYGSEVW